MAWTTDNRSINLITRRNGEIQEKKLTYIKTTDITATTMKAAVQGLVSLTGDTYVNGEIIDTYDLNESAASEEG